MEKTYDYSYLPCQFCVGKNHCEKCGEQIRQGLLSIEGVARVVMDVRNRRLTLSFDGADPEDVEDRADAMGVFL